VVEPMRVPVARRWESWVAGLILLTVVSGGLAMTLWRQTARAAGGAICGSVWHWRPGHGSPSGGMPTPADVAQATTDCRRAAAPDFWAGAALAVLAAASLGTSFVVVDRRGTGASR
jgi:hypothetical protein